MLLFGRHRWNGETGNGYDFNITLTNRGIPEGGGIYVFVRRRFVFFLKPLYVGKAKNFRSRISRHERWAEAWWNRGATERHFLKIDSGSRRSRVEEDLIRNLRPPMTDEHIPRSERDAPNDVKLRREFHLPMWRRCLRWIARRLW